MQVAPAELEAFILEHSAVADCAVIAVPDHWADEVPKAYIVRSNHVGLQESEAKTRREIRKYVEGKKSKHKWLEGGVEFIDIIPRHTKFRYFELRSQDQCKICVPNSISSSP